MKRVLPYLLLFVTVNANASGLNKHQVLPTLSADNTVLACDAGFPGGLKWSSGGGGGTPGGSDTQVQYNDSGAFGGDAGLTFNETTNLLTVTDGNIEVADTTGSGTTNSIEVDTDGSAAVLIDRGGSSLSRTALVRYITAGTTQFSGGLANATDQYILRDEGGNEMYSATDAGSTTTFNINGNLTLATDLVVAEGGTGVATITDGGLLIGKGTAAIENTGVLAKGTIVVGDGVTNPTTLTVGANGTILSADTSTASGLTWGTVVPHKTFINFPVHSTKLSADTAVRIDGGFYLWRLLFADGVSGNDKNLCLWQGRMDDNWQGGALTAKIDYHMTSSDSTSTAAGAVTFGVSVMAITSGDAAAMLTESFDTENSKTQEVPAVVSRDATVTIPLTTVDGLAAGDWFIVRLRRNGADTITGDSAVTSFAITQ